MESDQAVEAIPAAVEPFEGLESLRNERDRLCEFYAGSPPPSGIRQSEWTLRVDLLEHETACVLVGSPGHDQRRFSYFCPGQRVALEGTRAFAHVENGQGRYHSSERTSGTFCRRCLLSTAVNADKITATYTNGVLEVHLPKAQEAQPKKRAVQASN